jgi:hypothetical protein
MQDAYRGALRVASPDPARRGSGTPADRRRYHRQFGIALCR